MMTLFGPQALWLTGLGAILLGAIFMSRVREGLVRATEEEPSTAPATA